MYWIGRVNEATIRHDSDIEDYIANEADAWLTTWGQAWSYWAKSRCYEFDHSISPEDGNYVISFESLVKEQCTELFPERWNVPVTWMIDLGQSELISVESYGKSLEDIANERHTQEGYSKSGNQYLHLSVIAVSYTHLTLPTT